MEKAPDPWPWDFELNLLNILNIGFENTEKITTREENKQELITQTRSRP